ncbi:MAG: HD domain-containing protein [Candidatus Korarchaeota archaeon]|nr:HD domain-containing protein [Candidatus Korarchaeota archaeon]NIU85012.1 HD domain-containing protein [Candidatus Thorarchaeota archaeon]NIW15037.1 HD domain-containing protein [Candidatus Thorarchaeota archaeon]NIW53047.1 HD domain-containing protein [Candidatus Korarchaeota archaeon]
MTIDIKDPLYGYLRFEEDIGRIIDSPEFQRLRRIKQVFGSDYVYPGATHTRAEHSLGTAHLAKKMLAVIEEELERRGETIDGQERKSVILGALLHDVGHGPFSHAFEIYLEQFGLNHEDFTRKIILERMSSKIEAVGADPELVAEIAGGMEAKKTQSKPYLKQIVSSAVDADKLDYIKRDTYHTGAEYGFIDTDRIINCLSLYEDQICVREKAIQSLEAMLTARALAFKSIYYHKASRAAQILIGKAIEAGAEKLGLKSILDDLSEYIHWDDYTLWSALLHTDPSKKYMEMLRDRRLLKVALSISGSADRLSSALLDMFSSPRLLLEISNSIQEEAGIQEPVVVDSPTLPNIPYMHWVRGKAMEIPILTSSPSGKTEIRLMSRISRTAKALESFLYAIRVYTVAKHRKQAEKAAQKIFSGLSKKGVEELHM